MVALIDVEGYRLELTYEPYSIGFVFDDTSYDNEGWFLTKWNCLDIDTEKFIKLMYLKGYKFKDIKDKIHDLGNEQIEYEPLYS